MSGSLPMRSEWRSPTSWMNCLPIPSPPSHCSQPAPGGWRAAQGAAAGLEEALTAIEQAGRVALADLRRLVTLMRSDPAEGPGDSDPAGPARAFAADLAAKAGPA